MKVFFIFLIIIGGILLGSGFQESAYPTYSGKEVFHTEEAYVEFKKACAVEGVRILDVKELSSSPPIIVDFEIKSPNPFPYGKEDLTAPMFMIIMGTIIICGGFAVLGVELASRHEEK